MTSAEAFWKWFGSSRVVTSTGQPKTVYHATDVEFDEFLLTNDIGFHFGSIQAARKRAKAYLESDEMHPEDIVVVAAFLKIESPLRLPDLHTWDPRRTAHALVVAGVITSDQADAVDIVDLAQVEKWLKAAGYDGIVYKNKIERGGDSYIVFDSRQVKAIDNDGTWDGSDPKIRSNPREWTQDEMRREASLYSDQFSRGHHARVDANTLTWRYVARYDIKNLGSRSGWIEFMTDEREMWAEAGEPHRFDEMKKWWAKGDPNDPIIVVEIDGASYIWDGNHRVALSHEAGTKTIPAIVGRLR